VLQLCLHGVRALDVGAGAVAQAPHPGEPQHGTAVIHRQQREAQIVRQLVQQLHLPVLRREAAHLLLLVGVRVVDDGDEHVEHHEDGQRHVAQEEDRPHDLKTEDRAAGGEAVSG
jgi:hypothetical protein